MMPDPSMWDAEDPNQRLWQVPSHYSDEIRANGRSRAHYL